MPLWKKKKAAEPAAPLDVLRWKIVAVNILFAAMVVATLCFVAARQGKNALEEKHRLAFASLCSALEQPILETQTIDHKAIYSSALENRLVPALFEKGAPIENPYLQGDDAAPLLTLSEPMLEEARQSVDGRTACGPKRLSGRHTPCGTGVPSGLRNTVQSPRPVGIGSRCTCFRMPRPSGRNGAGCNCCT